MSEWKAEIVKLTNISKHPDADNLSISLIHNEYPAIFRTGDFEEGELVSFIPYDSIVPDNEFFHFLAKPDKNGIVPPVGLVPEKNRTIKARRIRSQYSDCIIVKAPEGFGEGDSVVEYFGLRKREYEEEAAERHDGGTEKGPDLKLFKYDLDGFPKYGYVFEEGEEVLITEKIEGENCAFVYSEGRLFVRSRNYWKRDANDTYWWSIPKRLNLEEKLSKYPNLVVWGEVYGNTKPFFYNTQMVNGKRQHNFLVFDIYDADNQKFLEWDQVEEIAKDIGLDCVPILYRGPFKDIEKLKELAEGNSVIGKHVREGFVIRSIPEAEHKKIGRKILKLKGKGYKLIKG